MWARTVWGDVGVCPKAGSRGTAVLVCGGTCSAAAAPVQVCVERRTLSRRNWDYWLPTGGRSY